MSENESQYRVVARVDGCDAETFDNIGATLSRTFRLDAVEVTSKLGADGVVVCQAASYEEARVYAKRVRDMGADSLVLDPTGKIVEQTGSPQKRNRPSEPALDMRTMMGGFRAPDAEGDLELGFDHSGSPAPPPRPLEELPPLDAPDGDLISLDGDSSQGASLPALDMLPAADLPLDDTAPSAPHAAAAKSPGMFGALDQLDADNLVLLDGSTEERDDSTPLSVEYAGGAAAAPAQPEQPPSSGAPSSEGPTFGGAEGPTFGGADLGDQFAPPDSEEEALELDTDYKAPGEGVGAQGVGAQGVGAQAVGAQDDQATAEAAAEAEAPAPPTPRGEAEWIPAEDGERGPQLDSLKAKPPPQAPPAAPLARRTTGEHLKPGWRAAVARSHSPLELPVELFRFYPRLRVIVGFALALGIGAIAPTCYAGGVVDKKIQPLLLDLSTARAHGHLMVGTPGYRSPEQIEETIGGIKTRHGTYAVLMWLAVSGVIGFLWFRFIRPD